MRNLKLCLVLACPVLFQACAGMIQVKLPDAPTTFGKTEFPSVPPLNKFKTAPVVKKLQNGDFEVTPTLIERQIELENWLKDVEAWKKANGVS